MFVLLSSSMPEQLQQLIEKFWDPWIIFGFSAQFVFFMRFVVQWWVSEKKKQSVIPVAFWYLSIAGSLMILVYSIRQQDIVFTTASILNTMIYVRNLMLIHARKKADGAVSEG
ncbi:hypothetical protein A2W32_04180 [candidate division WWE3 bacterium RBG_16_37_10]|uniref:Lipid A biosynthesis N-terminal domain-containing protein n=1 Tax=candidate division WWE3 bacterium RBG_16_37_10 TaxID=1802610 RepID=A0A1F4UV17_UNCKA|nr:MAG: hypothetical protein A2W32_04180 [candidate division WWE3 bacterium RBG_16_37_10]